MSKTKYTQQWSSYNEAQTKEAKLFPDILIELIDSLIQVRKPNRKNGRPYMDLKDMLFCCVVKCYYGKSSRRNTGYLSLAKDKGYIQKIPHFNTLLNYFKNPALTPLLKHMVEQSGIPLKEIEQNFATDASGFSTSLYGRWVDIRVKGYTKRKLFRKLHATSGTRTNIISAVEVTKGYQHDSPEFEKLVKITSNNFDMREMSADAGYLARKNFDVVHEVGAIPYIMFKKNCSSKSRGSLIYKRMFEIFTNHPEAFLPRYHLRSNSESVFSMIKRKFGTHLYNKNEVGQTNEILSICLAHNICVLIHESFGGNAILQFDECNKAIVRGGLLCE